MRSIAAIELELDVPPGAPPPGAPRLLALAEGVLEAWVEGRGEAPTQEHREGFRLLALHLQGSRGEPSFNACRETCREIAYHYNLLAAAPPGGDPGPHLAMMVMLVRHLALFVGGKMQVAKLGEFCCASKPLRASAPTMVPE